MKIALIHDWLETYAGAERVLEEMIEVFPDADLFCVVDHLDKQNRAFIKDKPVQTTFIQKLPLSKKMFRNYLPLMPLAIEQLNLSDYDVVLSSSHAVAKGVITGPNQIHISYVHTPIRYAWDLQHQYLEETGMQKGIKGLITRNILHYIRLWDYRTASSVDKFIANSYFISNRIWKFYKRDADVIYPPVDIEAFSMKANKEDFYLTASRLVPYKKIDAIVDAFGRMPEKKLVVIGDGPEMNKIKAKAKENITLLGFQPFEVLKDYMQRSKAFVFAAEEDFGITPVEAQACGTPVIAYGKGGALETIRSLENKEPTGTFFYAQEPDSIIHAVWSFEKEQDRISPIYCRNNAVRFSKSRFRTEIYNYVKNQYSQYIKGNEKIRANNSDIAQVTIS